MHFDSTYFSVLTTNMILDTTSWCAKQLIKFNRKRLHLRNPFENGILCTFSGGKWYHALHDITCTTVVANRIRVSWLIQYLSVPGIYEDVHVHAWMAVHFARHRKLVSESNEFLESAFKSILYISSYILAWHFGFLSLLGPKGNVCNVYNVVSTW